MGHISEFINGALLHDDPAECVEALKQDAARWRAVRAHFLTVDGEHNDEAYAVLIFGVPHELARPTDPDHYADQLVARAGGV